MAATALFRSLLVLLLTLPLLVSAAAQSPNLSEDAGLCPGIVEQALGAIGGNCADLASNSACYGYNRVGATFVQDVNSEFFSAPADRADLMLIESIRTTPLSLSDSEWGIAVLKVQANLPNTLPGQGVVFLLLGQTEVTNAVPAAAAFVPVDPVELTASVNANVRSAPTTQSNVLFAITAGTAVAADGRSEAGDWLRIVADGRTGWIFGELVSGADTSALPVIDDSTLGTMQAFYFTTAVGASACAQAPDALIIQGPKNITVALTVNEVSIRISSTILLRLTDAATMQISVIEGRAEVDNLLIPEGYTAFADLGGGGGWRDCQRLGEADFEVIRTFENIPANLLNYPITQPARLNMLCAPPGAAQPTPAPAPQMPPNPDATAEATAEGTGEAGTDTVPFGAAGTCAGLVGTYPVGIRVPVGITQFYWDGTPSAARYRVVISADNGSIVGIVETSDPSTSVAVDNKIWTGAIFTWEVQALDAGGQVLCASARQRFSRDVPPQTVTPAVTVTVTQTPTPTP